MHKSNWALNLLLFILIHLIGINSVPATTLLQDIQIPDEGLKNCIDKVAKRNNWTHASQIDVLYCVARQPKIRKLDGIQTLTHLEALHLSSNEIQNLKPLSSLTNLKVLDLSYNPTISSFKTLNDLVSLESLKLQRLDIVNLDFVRSISSLKNLDISWNKISDLSPLTNLSVLETLHIESNPIKDIGPIASLKNLKQLRFSYNTDIDLNPLIGLSKLSEINTYNYRANNRLLFSKNEVLANVFTERSKSYKNAKRKEVDVESDTSIKIAMGSTLKPMHYIDEKGELVGFEVDLVRKYARSIGKQVEIIDPYELNSTSLSLLLAGKVDMVVNSLDITTERQKWVTFSLPYFSSRTGLVVNAKAPTPFKIDSATKITIPDTHRLPIQFDTRRRFFNRSNAKTYKQNLKQAYDLIENEHYPDYNSYIFAYDWMALKQLDPKKYRVLDMALGEHFYGAVFRKNDFAYNMSWDSFIHNMKKSGEYQALHEKWFQHSPLPKITALPESQRYANSSCITVTPELSWSKDYGIELPAEYKTPIQFIKYLPYLNCFAQVPVKSALSIKAAQRTSYFTAMSQYLSESYDEKFGVYINELHNKIPYSNNSNALNKYYDKLTLDKGIIEMLPKYFSGSTDGKVTYQRYYVSAFYLKHPQQRAEVVRLYNNLTTENHKNILSWNFIGELSQPVLKLSLLDKTSNKTRTIKIANSTTGQQRHESPTYKIEIVKHDNAGKPLVKVNGITGKFQSLKATGGNETYGIVDIKNNAGRSTYAVGPIKRFSEDGNIMIMEKGNYEFHYNYDSGQIEKLIFSPADIEKEILDETNIILTKLWLNGAKQFIHGFTDDGSLYVLEPGMEKIDNNSSYNNQNNNRYYTKIYLKGKSEDKLKMVGKLPKSYRPRYHYLMDNKLFFTSIGYDDGMPPLIFYLDTGKVEQIEQDIYGAAMVPVGKHEILYCSGKSQFLLDTRILSRKPLKRNIFCPSKTGAFLRHPKAGYYIGHGWELL